MFKNILVPTDGSKLSQKAVKEAIDLAQESKSKVTALHVFPKFSGSPYGTFGPSEDILEEAHRNQAQAEGARLFTALQKSADAAGVPFESVLVENNEVWKQIIATAKKKKCDLICMQGLMWRATNTDGTLTYAFAESVKATYPFYAIRLAGGTLFLAGMLLMAWNVVKTVAIGRAADAEIPSVAGAVPAAA